MDIMYKRKDTLRVPPSDLKHPNFNNMYWTPIQKLFYLLSNIDHGQKRKDTFSSAFTINHFTSNN
ncbi:hypothetical protein DN390_23885 [Bacillus sp. SH7-1]|nr:hypothetical protein DN390_23885 [Bacillus sp. SH7-1]